MSDPSAAIQAFIDISSMRSRAESAEGEVVRLRGALDAIRWGYNVKHTSKWARDFATAALIADAALGDREGNGTERPQVPQPFRDEPK